jgi:hypothetical protein
MFLIPMQPLKTICGISFTISSNPEIVVSTRISEERYKIGQDYKITLKSIYKTFREKHFYFSDLEQLINSGTVQYFIKN